MCDIAVLGIPLKESERYQYHARYKHGIDVRAVASIRLHSLVQGCNGFIASP